MPAVGLESRARPGDISGIADLDIFFFHSRRSRLGDLEQGPCSARVAAQMNEEPGANCLDGVDLEQRVVAVREGRSPNLHTNGALDERSQRRGEPACVTERCAPEEKGEEGDDDRDEPEWGDEYGDHQSRQARCEEGNTTQVEGFHRAISIGMRW